MSHNNIPIDYLELETEIANHRIEKPFFRSIVSINAYDEITQQIFVLMKMLWRHLLPLYLLKTSSRGLDQDEYVRLRLTSLEDVFKTSSRRLQDIFNTSLRRLQDILKKPSRRLQDIFKTSSKRLQEVWQKYLQELYNMFSRRFEDVFKTSSRHLQDV